MSADIVLPYRPGALSRVLSWIDGLPGHGWWVFPGAAVALLAYAHAIDWATGRLPVGTFDPILSASVFYGPFTLGALAYVNRVARQSVMSFWPATGWPDGDRPAWTYAFVTSPGRFDLLALVVGVVISLGSFLAAPQAALGTGNDRVMLLLADLPSLLFGYCMFPLAIVHTLRQLRLVSRIHREATAIDPFDRVPVYAFSRLTAQIGLVYVLVGSYSLTVNGAFQAGNVFSLAALLGSIGFGIICFIWPLWGIHDRLVAEKELLLVQVERRIRRLGEEMYHRVDAGEFDSTKVVSEALAGLGALRERIVRLPTWPWPPQVIRGFVTALLLPVIVYVVSRTIGTQIGA
jgi:hypothetical protein